MTGYFQYDRSNDSKHFSTVTLVQRYNDHSVTTILSQYLLWLKFTGHFWETAILRRSFGWRKNNLVTVIFELSIEQLKRNEYMNFNHMQLKT